MLTLPEIAKALGGEVSGQQVLAPGPNHQSPADRSMSVKISKRGNDIVVYSHSGDDPLVCKDYARAKLRLPAFQPKRRGNGAARRSLDDELDDVLLAPKPNLGTIVPEPPAKKPKLVCTYDYCDRDGKLLYQVQRFEEPKTFRQRRPNGKGGWITVGVFNGIERVPYRWKELADELAAHPDTSPIFITEGEKDCDNVRRLGLTASCVAGGKWTDEIAAVFKGLDIIILEDNDQPGHIKANVAAKTLHGIAKTVRIAPFTDIAKQGGDVSDWIKLDPVNHNAEALLARCSRAPLFDPATATTTPGKEAVLQTICAADVTIRGFDWLWPNRFAIRKIGLIAGLPDEGKGQLLCYIAAQTTQTPGGEWPCNEGHAVTGNVIILSAEDDASDTLVPRLIAAGADLKRVHIIKMVRDRDSERMFNLASDLELLRKKIIEIGNVVLVEIDPISAYFGVGKVDSFRTTDVRAVLGPLVDLAEKQDVAILGIMHFNKKVDITNVLLRISDSLAFGAAARHVFGVIDDAANERKLVVRGKNNQAARKDNQTLSYRFGAREVGIDPKTNKPIWAPFIIWDNQYVDVTAIEAMQAASDNKAAPAARDEAKKFLQDQLACGPLPVKEIEDAAKGHGIGWRTVERAKRDLKIVARKDPDNNRWAWHLPEQMPQWNDK
jgi:putative DNA primase/helicase